MADEITPKEEVIVEAPIEPISEPIQASEAPTAQIPVNEPLDIPTETEPKPVETETQADPVAETIITEPVKVEIQTEIITEPAEEIKPEILEPVPESVKTESKSVQQTSEIKSELIPETKPKQESKPEPEQPKPIPEVIPAIAVISKSKSFARELLIKARSMIQFRKRKKLDKIMTLFLKKQKITNDEVEKFLHISDATTGRYLSILVKEGKIKQSGKTGKSVFYSKI